MSRALAHRHQPRRQRVVSSLLAAVALFAVSGCGSDDRVGTSTDVSTTAVASTVPSSSTSEIATSSPPVTTTAVGGSPASSPPETTTATSEPSIDSPLTLLADGLGIVRFQEEYTDVIESLTGVLGEPSHVGQDVFEPAIGSMRSVTWGHLRVDFTGGAGALYFNGYLLARDMHVEDVEGEFRFTLPDWAPEPWVQQLSTEAGVGLGDSAADADQAYPTVFAARCNLEVEPTTMLVDDGTADQLFAAPEQVGLFLHRPINGTVWAIGAQAAPNPLLCDGRGS